MVPSVARDGQVRDALNARYFAGRPSNVLSEAGVLVHMLDGGVNSVQPWRRGYQDFLSASLLNARKLPHGLYHGSVALVVSPSSTVRCSYPQDSGTKSWVPSKAVSVDGRKLPGCGPTMRTPGGTLGSFPTPRHDSGYPCAFPPSMFARMLEVFEGCDTDTSAYTEVVVSLTDEFAFEAVVGDGYSVQNALLEHWGLSREQLPLLQWGPGLKGKGPLFV